jgi:hypothetical protein
VRLSYMQYLNIIVGVYQKLKDPGVSIQECKQDENQINYVPYSRSDFRSLEREEFLYYFEEEQSSNWPRDSLSMIRIKKGMTLDKLNLDRINNLTMTKQDIEAVLHEENADYDMMDSRLSQSGDESDEFESSSMEETLEQGRSDMTF